MKLLGLNETLAALDSIPSALIKEALEPALIAAAQPMIQALAIATPVKTSELVNHLMFGIEINEQTGRAVAQVGFGKLGYVARFVEFGHREVGHKPNLKEYGNVKPHPFMRQAFANSIGAATDAFVRSITMTIDSGRLNLKRAA